MAHSEDTKARAMASLMLGNTTRYVAAQTGIPRRTLRRWQIEAHQLLREVLGDPLVGMLAAIGGPVLQQNGPKKRGDDGDR
jgi:hypothetical protein